MNMQQTNQRTVMKFKIIVGILAVMAAFVFIMKIGSRKPADRPEDKVLAAMDAQLDSIMRADYPEGTVVLSRGVIEKLETRNTADPKDRTTILRYEVAQEGGKATEEELEKLRKDADEATKRIAEQQKGRVEAYFRNVVFQLPDSVKKTCYQRMSQTMGDSQLIMMMTVKNIPNIKIYENNNVLQ